MNKRIVSYKFCIIGMVIGIIFILLTLRGDDNKNIEEAYSITATSNEISYKVSSYSIGMGYYSNKNRQEISNESVSMESLKNMFPNGMYWNHEGNPNSDNPDSVTAMPCHSTTYDPTCCNLYSYGAQCHGYSLRLSYLYHNSPTEKYGISHNINDLQVGDVVRFRIGAYDHSIFVTQINGNEIYYTDCNFDLHCRIRWGVRITKQELQSLMNQNLHSVYNYPGQYSTTGFILSYSNRKIVESYYIKDCDIEVSSVNLVNNEEVPKISISRNGVKLKSGTDYSVFFNDYLHSGEGIVTIYGEGKYEGSVQKKFEVIKGVIDECSVQFLDGSNGVYTYTGNKILPEFQITNKYGIIVDPKYYIVNYERNPVNIGKHKIYVYQEFSQHLYYGGITIEYEIIEDDESREISKCDIDYDKRVEFLGGEAKCNVEISCKGENLIYGKDYELDYNNNTGKGEASVVVTGIGKYVGQVKLKYEIYVEDIEYHIN